jgi:hypothetical protein
MSHQKPSPVSFVVGDYKVQVKVLNPMKPTGLARVGYEQSGWDVTVIVNGKRYDRVGGLMWEGEKCAWYLASEDGLWAHGNTLSPWEGRGWVYRSDQAALISLAKFVKVNLSLGYPIKLTRDLA